VDVAGRKSRLEELDTSTSQRFSVEATTAGDVVIHRNGHAYGVLCAENCAHNFSPAVTTSRHTPSPISMRWWTTSFSSLRDAPMDNSIDIITVRDTLSYIYYDMCGKDEFSEVRRSLRNTIRLIRQLDRGRRRRARSVASGGLMIMILMGSIVGGYIMMSAAGIDIFPGNSSLHPVYAFLSKF